MESPRPEPALGLLRLGIEFECHARVKSGTILHMARKVAECDGDPLLKSTRSAMATLFNSLALRESRTYPSIKGHAFVFSANVCDVLKPALRELGIEHVWRVDYDHTLDEQDGDRIRFKGISELAEGVYDKGADTIPLEIVTPVMTLSDLKPGGSLRTMFERVLSQSGEIEYVHDALTSQHMHFSFAGASGTNLLRVGDNLHRALSMWWLFEPMVFAMCAGWRSEVHTVYSVPLRLKHKMGSEFSRWLASPGTRSGFEDVVSMCPDRYSGLNLLNMNTWGPGTIEVRALHGTSDLGETSMFAWLFASMFASGIFGKDSPARRLDKSDREFLEAMDIHGSVPRDHAKAFGILVDVFLGPDFPNHPAEIGAIARFHSSQTSRVRKARSVVFKDTFGSIDFRLEAKLTRWDGTGSFHLSSASFDEIAHTVAGWKLPGKKAIFEEMDLIVANDHGGKHARFGVRMRSVSNTFVLSNTATGPLVQVTPKDAVRIASRGEYGDAMIKAIENSFTVLNGLSRLFKRSNLSVLNNVEWMLRDLDRKRQASEVPR